MRHLPLLAQTVLNLDPGPRTLLEHDRKADCQDVSARLAPTRFSAGPRASSRGFSASTCRHAPGTRDGALLSVPMTSL